MEGRLPGLWALTLHRSLLLWHSHKELPSLVGAAEANTKAHLVAEAVPRGTTLLQ